VFPVPSASVSDASVSGAGVTGAGARRTIWIATREGTAARREVTIAEGGDEALVSDGIGVGDQVIVDPPATLTEGARVTLLAADSSPSSSSDR